MQTKMNSTPSTATNGLNLNLGATALKDTRQHKPRVGRLADHPAFADTIVRLELGRLPGERNWQPSKLAH